MHSMVTIALVSAGAQAVRLASGPDTRRRPRIPREVHRVIDFLASVVDREVVHAAVPGRAAMIGCTATTRVSLREP